MKKIVWAVLTVAISTFAQDEFALSKSTIGGYGELHLNYQNVEGKEDEAAKLDFHRFVLFFGYQWNEAWSFKSELELEHNFVREGQGEFKIEQAYVNYKQSDALNYQFGVILAAVGLINENHEPSLFASVERPLYHKNIIPTTWFGNGAALTGIVAEQIDYKVIVMEGLNTENISSGGIRSGRQNGYESSLENVLLNGRVDYIGYPGLRAGVSLSRNHLVTNDGAQNFDAIHIAEAHAKFEAYDIYLVAEGAYISYDAAADQKIEASSGFYGEAGYNIGTLLAFQEAKLMPWVRYETFNTASSYSGETAVEEAGETARVAAGVAFKPIAEVVFKADYTYQTKGKNDDVTHFVDVGVGYQF